MQQLPTILVTGANGQLGKELRHLAVSRPQFNFIFLIREDLLIHDFEIVRQFFESCKPTYLVNCAAYTAVDKAEQDKDLAYQTNADAVEILAQVCKEYNVKLIHISTDYVFDGNGIQPYKEDDAINPQGIYGLSKAKGEIQALQAYGDTIIIRTAWVYSAFGKNFVKTMVKLMQEKDELKVVNDQIGSPTYAADLAEAILQIISFKKWEGGIYHYTNDGILSWYDFAVAIKELTGSNCNVIPIATSQYPTPAKRPAYSVLDKTKIQAVYQVEIRPWRQSLKKCIENLA